MLITACHLQDMPVYTCIAERSRPRILSAHSVIILAACSRNSNGDFCGALLEQQGDKDTPCDSVLNGGACTFSCRNFLEKVRCSSMHHRLPCYKLLYCMAGNIWGFQLLLIDTLQYFVGTISTDVCQHDSMHTYKNAYSVGLIFTDKL